LRYLKRRHSLLFPLPPSGGFSLPSPPPPFFPPTQWKRGRGGKECFPLPFFSLFLFPGRLASLRGAAVGPARLLPPFPFSRGRVNRREKVGWALFSLLLSFFFPLVGGCSPFCVVKKKTGRTELCHRPPIFFSPPPPPLPWRDCGRGGEAPAGHGTGGPPFFFLRCQTEERREAGFYRGLGARGAGGGFLSFFPFFFFSFGKKNEGGGQRNPHRPGRVFSPPLLFFPFFFSRSHYGKFKLRIKVFFFSFPNRGTRRRGREKKKLGYFLGGRGGGPGTLFRPFLPFSFFPLFFPPFSLTEEKKGGQKEGPGPVPRAPQPPVPFVFSPLFFFFPLLFSFFPWDHRCPPRLRRRGSFARPSFFFPSLSGRGGV